MDQHFLYTEAVTLLRQLIATPSISCEENHTADILEAFLVRHGVEPRRAGNNVYAFSQYYDAARPTLLLNSHHDTVKPNKGYTLNPFEPIELEGRLYGLGSNDAGGCLVSLLATFLHFHAQPNLPFNVVMAASAEEEISGHHGIEMLLPILGRVDFGIVGEPTQMEMAVAERGLLVLDALATGVAGHAARNEGVNALYHALDDIQWIRTHHLDRISPLLGESRMTVTVIETENKQHNVVPPQCHFVVDIRVNELYTFEEILVILRANLKSAVTPRSTRLRSTYTPMDHPLVKAGISLGRGYYGSPTTSDKALMPFCTLKMGPGDSARSHTANEFIYLKEIEEGIAGYIAFVEALKAYF
jgi:acetylornithine deacetylase